MRMFFNIVTKPNLRSWASDIKCVKNVNKRVVTNPFYQSYQCTRVGTMGLISFYLVASYRSDVSRLDLPYPRQLRFRQMFIE